MESEGKVRSSKQNNVQKHIDEVCFIINRLDNLTERLEEKTDFFRYRLEDESDDSGLALISNESRVVSELIFQLQHVEMRLSKLEGNIAKVVDTIDF